MDRRSLPRCTDCRRAVLYLFGGKYSRHCYGHATADEKRTRNDNVHLMIREAINGHETNCSCVLPEHSCPQCRPEPWDGETELEF